MSLAVFQHTSELASRTATAITDFQRSYPQFDFDAQLLEPASRFVTRGKLFRGSVCLTVSAALLGQEQPSAAAWSAAIALELAGSAILMQDDVMDNALLRRDETTLHRVYQQHWCGVEADKTRFGESMSVCVSDTLFFVATKQLTDAPVDESVRIQLLSAMSEQIATLAMAQAEELRMSALSLTDPSITEDTITRVIVGKTARYTAMWPLQFAGILAQVDVKTMVALQEFGRLMGIIFQISDDRLGLFGDPAITGKDADSDAKTAKKTLYALYARDHLQGEIAEQFNQLYGKSDLTVTELGELQQLLKQTGIYQQVELRLQEYVQQAHEQLTQLVAFPVVTTLLAETVEFLASRER